MDSAIGRRYSQITSTTKPRTEYSGASKEEQKDRAQKTQAGFLKHAKDNPVSKAISWFSK